MASKDPKDLQESLDSQDLLAAQVLRETEDSQEHLVHLAPLVPPVLKVLQDSLERRETQAMPSLSVV